MPWRTAGSAAEPVGFIVADKRFGLGVKCQFSTKSNGDGSGMTGDVAAAGVAGI